MITNQSRITGPNIHGGLTYKEWLTGNIPVVPYPVADVTAPVRFKIDWSHKSDAGIELALLPSKGTVKPQIFFMGLKRVGSADKARWLREEPQLRQSLLEAQFAIGEHKHCAVLIIIGGVEGAGKSEMVHLLNEWMDPRHIQTNAFADPSDEERERPPMWRFWRVIRSPSPVGRPDV